MTTTKTTTEKSKAPQTGNGTGASADDEFDDYHSYQAVGSITADGFWNIPKEESEAKSIIGEKLCGILLTETRTDKKGKAIDNPFYIFELTRDHARITARDEGGKGRKVITLKKGQRVGVSAGWNALQNLMRKVGYGFVLTFQGKEHFPQGRVGNKIDVKISPTPKKEIEQMNPAKEAEGDKGGEGDEIPF